MATCLKHPGSTIYLFGTYGKPGQKRQRFKGIPLDGQASHTFMETLPRHLTEGGVCDACGRAYLRHEGPQGPRHFVFTVENVAEALVAVGRGESYTGASIAVREKAFRGGPINLLDVSDEWNLVADWVEVFAPILYRAFAVSHSPKHVVIDHVPFHIHDVTLTGEPKSSGKEAFCVYGAVGHRLQRPFVIRLEAFHTRDPI